MQDVTASLAAFSAAVSLETVPARGAETACHALVDCLGVALAASEEALVGPLRAYLEAMGGRPAATAIGLGVQTSPELAALAGGAMAHALDYDDVAEPLYGHPSVVLAPAVLAAAEESGASGQRVLEGYIAGFEVCAALGSALNPHHYGLGWHATSTVGALGAAAAVARVLGLDSAQTETALGIAASLAGGLRRNFGSMTKPLHAGNAARAGVLAGYMARFGLTAAGGIVEARYGFADLFYGGVPERLAETVALLGTRWSIVADGIWFKQYPCCASTHRSLDLLFQLRQEHGFGPEEIEAITCRVPTHVPQILIHPRPRTALEAKFSLQYCLAAALIDGQIGLATFGDEQVARPAVRALGERVQMVAVPVPGEETEVEVRLTDGRAYGQRLVDPKGHPRNPLSPTELEAKFGDCARRFPGARAAEALTALRNLSELDRVDRLMARLHGR